MPLLEIGSPKSLSQRFNFLNISGSLDGQDSGEQNDLIITSEPLRLVTPVGNESRQASGQQRDNEFFSKDEMTQICVVKSTIKGQKLFINLLKPSFPIYEDSELILFSNVDTDADKSGQPCYVLSALVFSPLVSSHADKEIHRVLSVLRTTLQDDVADAYSIPKLKRKGQLGMIRKLFATPQPLSSGTQPSQSSAPQKRLITEVDGSTSSKSKFPGSTSSGHKISKRSIAILASPLPTMYTHHLSIPLAPSSDGSKHSWSIYFDSQDSTLKILIPPKEEFETIAVKTDDFRAFAKDQHLHIFYIGI